jgi:hypothetical protein
MFFSSPRIVKEPYVLECPSCRITKQFCAMLGFAASFLKGSSKTMDIGLVLKLLYSQVIT